MGEEALEVLQTSHFKQLHLGNQTSFLPTHRMSASRTSGWRGFTDTRTPWSWLRAETLKADQTWSHDSQHPYLLGPLGYSPEERKFHSLDFLAQLLGCQEIKVIAIQKQALWRTLLVAVSPLLIYHYLQNESNECMSGKIMQVDSSTQEDGLPCLLIHLSIKRIWWYVNPLQLVFTTIGQELPGFRFRCVCVYIYIQ